MDHGRHLGDCIYYLPLGLRELTVQHSEIILRTFYNQYKADRRTTLKTHY
jgi:hypothetical protein